MRNFLTLVLFVSPVLASANQQTVEVNLAALSQISATGMQFAMRPPAPRYEGWQPAPVEQVVTAEPAPAEPADEENKVLPVDGEFSGNVGIVSEYVFRGVTQSREGIALQGGLDYEDPSGAYVGLWASSVDFRDGDEASTEVDYYGGYSWEVADGLSLDAGGIYYSYPGAEGSKNYDFIEGYVGAEYALGVAGQDVTTSATLNYSPDYFAASGQSYYLKFGAETEVAENLTLDGHVARQWVEDEAAFALPDYNDWSLGLAYAMNGFDMKLQYIDTDLEEDKCSDGCDGKGVLSVSRSL